MYYLYVLGICNIYLINENVFEFLSYDKIELLRYIQERQYCGEVIRRKLLEQQEKLNKPIGMFMIIDLQGLDRNIPFLSIAKTAVYEQIKFCDEYYPEATKRVFVINAPTWFAWVFTFFKHFLSSQTREVTKAL